MTLTNSTQSRAAPPTNSPFVEALTRAAVIPLTIAQYQKMIDEKIVAEDNTAELLRGVIVRKDRSSPGEDPMGHGSLHRLVIALITALAPQINSPLRHLQIQLPVACPPDGVPEPDASIVRGGPRDYKDDIPRASDVSCAIEVAHSSLDHDREDKLPIYAAAGIPQYIIINLFNNSVEIYSDPDPTTEEYRTKVTIERDGVVALRCPDGELSVRAAAILP